MKNLSALISNIKYLYIYGNNDIIISSIEYNSKNITANSLFVAIKGDNFDGHSFIAESIENGAIAIVCEVLPQNMRKNITYIQVQDTRLALAQLSNAFYDFPSDKLNIIGITGTNGKTTITYLLNNIFQYFNRKSAIIGTTGIFIDNNKIPSTHTTPESLELFSYLNQCVNDNIEFVAIEVSSHSLVQHRVDGVEFRTAVFTNLTQDHLDYHKTMQEYASAKKILFDNLTNDAIAIINSDDAYSDYIIQDCKAKTIIRVGHQKYADYIVTNENISLKGINFDIKFNNNIYNIQSRLLGKFNIDNLAQAFAIAVSLGFDPQEICNSLKDATGAPGRMEAYNLQNGAIAIIDYAHTPDALEKALQSLKNIHKSVAIEGKIICVFGCGGNRDRGKRPKMGKIACKLSDYVILTNDNPRDEDPEAIFNDILVGISENYKNNVQIIPNRADAIKYAIDTARENDIILIAGKGHEEYQIIGKERFPFSDKNIIIHY